MKIRVIYPNDNGGIAILIPTQECLDQYTIKEIADKDVPYGKPYKIVDVSEIPLDRTFRDAWEIDLSLLTDGVGAESNEFPIKE